MLFTPLPDWIQSEEGEELSGVVTEADEEVHEVVLASEESDREERGVAENGDEGL